MINNVDLTKMTEEQLKALLSQTNDAKTSGQIKAELLSRLPGIETA